MYRGGRLLNKCQILLHGNWGEELGGFMISLKVDLLLKALVFERIQKSLLSGSGMNGIRRIVLSVSLWRSRDKSFC